MWNHRTSCALLVALIAVTGTATAQQSAIQPDSARAQIQSTLRAFYFNLEHQDWEALTADILAAKVVASRTAPVMPTSETDPVPCSANAPARVSHAAMQLDGGWAEVSVPRCTVASAGADEFRLIHFEQRWRIVGIRLFQEPLAVSSDR
jgi:hypothetical protein